MIKKVIIAILVLLGLVAASQAVLADSWDQLPVCTQGQLDKGDMDVNGQCVAPSPAPSPQPAVTPTPTPTPVQETAPSPQPAVAPAPTAPVDTFQGK